MDTTTIALAHAEEAARKSGSIGDCRTAAMWCRRAAQEAPFRARGPLLDRAATWDAQAEAQEVAS